MNNFLIESLLWMVICQNIESQSKSESYSSLFGASGYPQMGDIPLLNRKIFRAMRVTIREHPYIVSIRRNYVHYLTGSLLTKNVAVTVAHPIYRILELYSVPISELNIVVGENYSDRGTTLLTVVLVLVHEDFDPYTLKADIALLRVNEDLLMRSSSKTIALVSPSTALGGKRAFVTGWGRCDFTGKELCLPRSSVYNPDEWMDPMLRTISFKITASNNACDIYHQHDVRIGLGMLCVGESRDVEAVAPCLGVPGAALVLRGKLVGVLSWGLGCGYGHDLPLVYTSIQYYMRWLVDNVGLLKNITQQDIKQLFLATKSYKLSNWLLRTRVYKPLWKQVQYTKELQPLDIDKELSKLKGKLYDIRDFIYEGTYHSYKRNLYRNLKLKHNDMVTKTLNRYSLKSEPFLNKTFFNLITDFEGVLI